MFALALRSNFDACVLRAPAYLQWPFLYAFGTVGPAVINTVHGRSYEPDRGCAVPPRVAQPRDVPGAVHGGHVRQQVSSAALGVLGSLVCLHANVRMGARVFSDGQSLLLDGRTIRWSYSQTSSPEESLNRFLFLGALLETARRARVLERRRSGSASATLAASDRSASSLMLPHLPQQPCRPRCVHENTLCHVPSACDELPESSTSRTHYMCISYLHQLTICGPRSDTKQCTRAICLLNLCAMHIGL